MRLLHWSAVGQATATDAAICAYAREHGYVILTNDLDFPQILAHTGVQARAFFSSVVSRSCQK